MSTSWIESGAATKRTLILCLVLGLSAAVHRWSSGLRDASAAESDRLAAVRDTGADAPAAPARAPVTPTPSPSPPKEPRAAPEPERPTPRTDPYARRLWTMDPFRSPNVLRRAELDMLSPERAHPLLDQARTQEVLSRTELDREQLPNGTTRISINMPGASAAPEPAHSSKAAEPARPSPLMANQPVALPQPKPSKARSLARPSFLPVMFAFAGHDLTREESRRWTLAAAFESRGY